MGVLNSPHSLMLPGPPLPLSMVSSFHQLRLLKNISNFAKTRSLVARVAKATTKMNVEQFHEAKNQGRR